MHFLAAIIASAVAAAAMLPEQADAHAFLLLPKADIKIAEKNFYAYVVPGEKVPPFSSYTTGDAERNSQGFTANYKKVNAASLKSFIMANQVPATGGDIKPGGTAECGYSNPNAAPQPIPDHVEFGNYNVQNPSGLHPGPCEAWCDDEIVVPFTEDCRKLFQKPIPYEKAKCAGKSRFTFYWLATHFAPFQVYIGCAPLQGGSAGGASGGGAAAGGGNRNSTAPASGNNNNNGGNSNGGGINNNGGSSNMSGNNGNSGGGNGNNNANNNRTNGAPNGGNGNTSGGNNNNNAGGNNNNAGSNNKSSGSSNNNSGGNGSNNNRNAGANNNQNKPQGGNNGFGRSLDFSDLSGM